MNRYLINSRRKIKSLLSTGMRASTFPLFVYFTYWFRVVRMRMHIHAFSSSAPLLFFAFPFICFFFLLFFFLISRWNPTKGRCYVKRSSTLFRAPFRRRFSSRLYPNLPLTPILSISILPRLPPTSPSRQSRARVLCLFLSWWSPLIQSRLNYAGYSSGDSTKGWRWKKKKTKSKQG